MMLFVMALTFVLPSSLTNHTVVSGWFLFLSMKLYLTSGSRLRCRGASQKVTLRRRWWTRKKWELTAPPPRQLLRIRGYQKSNKGLDGIDKHLKMRHWDDNLFKHHLVNIVVVILSVCGTWREIFVENYHLWIFLL